MLSPSGQFRQVPDVRDVEMNAQPSATACNWDEVGAIRVLFPKGREKKCHVGWRRKACLFPSYVVAVISHGVGLSPHHT
jgi:hypothetical protein